jgi:hypothetical protein
MARMGPLRFAANFASGYGTATRAMKYVPYDTAERSF